MSTQFKSKLYLLVIVILLISNMILLYFLFENKKSEDRKGSHDREARIKEFLKKDIGFDPEQIKQLDTVNRLHKEKMKAAFDSLRGNKEQQFRELGKGGFNDSVISGIISQYAEKQKTMEWQMYHHFSTIRKLCKEKQLARFDSLFYKVWSRKGGDEKTKKEGKEESN